jgi:hypothetical protein
VLSRAGIKAPEESLFDWTMGTFMKRRCHLTAAEKRVLSALRTHGRALRIWVGHRQDDYSWWIAGQPVTRMIYKNVPLVPPSCAQRRPEEGDKRNIKTWEASARARGSSQSPLCVRGDAGDSGIREGNPPS